MIVLEVSPNSRCAGSFNSWQQPLPLHKCTDDVGDWFVTMVSKPGLHQVFLSFFAHERTAACQPELLPWLQYKFLVDDVWRTSPCEAIVSDGQASLLSEKLSQTLASQTSD